MNLTSTEKKTWFRHYTGTEKLPIYYLVQFSIKCLLDFFEKNPQNVSVQKGFTHGNVNNTRDMSAKKVGQHLIAIKTQSRHHLPKDLLCV